MSSNTDNPPVYQEKPASAKEVTDLITTTSRLAGTVRTCSVAERQIDYFSIVRVSDSSYHLALTVDPTPLYRIELIPEPTKVGNIQIFSMSDPTLPAVAAAYVSNDLKSKTLPIGTVCTASPTEPDALWRPITRVIGFLSTPLNEYSSQIPVITVPGKAADYHHFTWKIADSGRVFRLFWEGPPPLVPLDLYDFVTNKADNIFATVNTQPDSGETLVAMRGGRYRF
uniref:Uncharacterized protein n=1 Tax=Bionectria ochroleuca TaxID=29856 RepID=A0A8H7MZ06_BIOOC